MRTLNKISNAIDKACGWFLILCFALMTVTYFGQIVLRYVFHTGIHWTEELTRYTNVALVMIGSAMMAKRGTHINVSVLETIVPQSIKKWIIIAQQIITGIFFGIAVKISFDMIKLAGTQVSTNMRIPMAAVYGIFPVAFSILVFQVIVFVANSIMKKEEA
ncbi:MAG: TRAP transporter small permease [Pseudomonadota bacterium]